MLARIPNLIDPDKISIDGTDDADPHVIALALFVGSSGFSVGDLSDLHGLQRVQGGPRDQRPNP